MRRAHSHPHPHHSPLTTHHSPLTTHHSPLTTHHSPLTTHHSTFTLTLTTLTLALTLTLTRYESIYEGSRSRLPGPKRGIDDKGRPRGFRAGPEEALVRQKEVNTFLSSFVSNNLEVSTVRT